MSLGPEETRPLPPNWFAAPTFPDIRLQAASYQADLHPWGDSWWHLLVQRPQPRVPIPRAETHVAPPWMGATCSGQSHGIQAWLCCGARRGKAPRSQAGQGVDVHISGAWDRPRASATLNSGLCPQRLKSLTPVGVGRCSEVYLGPRVSRKLRPCGCGGLSSAALTWYKVPLMLHSVQSAQEKTSSCTPCHPSSPHPRHSHPCSLLGASFPGSSLGFVQPCPCGRLSPEPQTGSGQAAVVSGYLVMAPQNPRWRPQPTVHDKVWSRTLTAVLDRAAVPLLVGQDRTGTLGTVHGCRAVAGVAGCGGGGRQLGVCPLPPPKGPPPGSTGLRTVQTARWGVSR